MANTSKRPKRKRERKQDPTVAFRVPQRLLDEIDRRAQKDRRRRSDFLRILLEDALLTG